MSAPILAATVGALDIELEGRNTAERLLAELLERIGQVTGVELSTVPGSEQVTAALAVLDSLASPTTEKPGHYWGDPLGNASPEGITGPFESYARAVSDADQHADELPHGFVTLHVRDGQMLAPMFVAPSRTGAN